MCTLVDKNIIHIKHESEKECGLYPNIRMYIFFLWLISSVGYNHVVFARPDFYHFLLSKVPKERIHFGKKVTSLEQNKEGVMIRCADGTTYHGDILVGADGAYSGVRQALYKRLEKAGKLPPADTNELNKGFICMVGTTDPLDPAKYPGVDDLSSHGKQIIGKKTLHAVRKKALRLPTFLF